MTLISQSPQVRAPSVDDSTNVVRPQYTFFRRQHELTLNLRGVERRHAIAVAMGDAEFALIDESPLLVLCARFGDAIPWACSTFSWHHMPSNERVLPPEAGSEDERRIQLQVILADGDDGSIKATRCVTFSLDFSRALNEAIREQARLSYDPREQERRFKELKRRCPTPDSMVVYAAARTPGLP